jgi:alanine-synthesizing transaminase
MKFARRVPDDLRPNRFAAELAAARAAGRSLIDLTTSNPTQAAIDYPPDLLAPLASPRGLVYRPEPFGLREARSAVAADYARRGVSIDADRIVLTASTSEAYSLLFKVLCEPGDEVLVPRPSYPLFEHLTRLDGVIARPYELEYHGRWGIELSGLERDIGPRTRAVLCVHPNNPTGSFVSAAELDRLAGVCAHRQVAIIADEVFADYELTPGVAARSGRMFECRDTLVFGLGGLSKSVGLPQVKLAWIGVAGPAGAIDAALARLELACDTYLSVSTPAQLAAAELLERGASIRRQIQARVARNHAALQTQASAVPACTPLAADAGWYAVLQVPSFGSEEDLVVDLLRTEGVVVHPGYFFDFPRESFLVVSLLAREEAFAPGLSRVLRHFDCRPGPA